MSKKDKKKDLEKWEKDNKIMGDIYYKIDEEKRKTFEKKQPWKNEYFFFKIAENILPM
jgi:hypothetical protein